jgi:hypothetical protein
MRNIAWLLLVALLLSGCDLFTVRDADPPGTPAPWNDFATTWQLALQNLEYCYEDSRNAVRYTGIFRQDYRFHFAAQDVSDFSITPTWDRSQEQDMIQLLHIRYKDIAVELQPMEQQDIISSAEATLYRQYALSGVLRNGSEGRTTLASGNLELHYRLEYGYWYIDKWYDYRGSAGSTWGKLKHDNS